MDTKAFSKFTIKSATTEDGERIIRGVATTPTPDRAADIVVPEGAVFSLPIPFLWQHRHDQPIGHVIDAAVKRSGIEVVIKMAKVAAGPLKTRLDEAWQAIETGLVRGLSIGFRGVEVEPLASGGWRFRSWDWLELSAVTIPANAEASITAIKSAARPKTRVVKLDAAPSMKEIPTSATKQAAEPDDCGTYLDAVVREAGEAAMKKQTVSRYEFTLMMDAAVQRIQEINKELDALRGER